jgi:hypothetical protein
MNETKQFRQMPIRELESALADLKASPDTKLNRESIAAAEEVLAEKRNPMRPFKRIIETLHFIQTDGRRPPALRVLFLLLFVMASPYLLLLLFIFPDKYRTQEDFANQIGIGIFVACMVFVILIYFYF